MSNRTEGSKYLETKHLSCVHIAKLVRADVKAAIAKGELPKGIKVSVRFRHVTHSSGIDATVTGLPEGFRIRVPNEECERNRFGQSRPWLTREANAVIETLERILAAYNYDNSDIMTDYFDVRFYSSVGFYWKLEDAA